MKKTLLCLALTLAMALSGALPLFASEASDEVDQATGAAPLEVAPGYDYERFRDAGITLNVYNWGEYISDGSDGEYMNVNAAFEELTGIKVNYATYDTNESLRAKLMSGGAEYDVIIPSDYMIGQLAREDLLAPLNFDNIPNFGLIGDAYKGRDYDPEDLYSVAYTWGYVGIIYNTTMVDDAVDSWDILWNEKYSGDILMIDNSRDAFAIALRKLGLPLNPENTDQIEQAARELEKQRGLVQAYVMDQVFDKMEGGEAAMAPYYAGDALIMSDANPDLAFAVPDEGTNYFVDAMCVPKSSTNREAAEMYINFMCETPVALANTLVIGYSTPQVEAEAALPADIRDNAIMYPEASVLENTWTFNVLPEELSQRMDDAWAEMRTSNTESTNWLMPFALGLAVVVIVVLFVLRARKKRREEY